MPVPTQILFALLTHIGGPLMHMPNPDPEQNQIHDHSGVPVVSIAIADHLAQVEGGQQVRYEVTVTNPGSTETPVTIKLTLSPSAVTSIRADNAAVIANAVAWKNMLTAGETRTYAVDGVVSSKVDTSDLAVTACVHLSPDAPAMSCATDLNIIAAPPPANRKLAWLTAIALGILAVIGSVWLQNKIQPELLTPLNADPGQPGGAPSV